MIRVNPVGPRLLYSIVEFGGLTGLCRTRVFQEIKEGRLAALKCGRRTLIPAAEVEAWIASLVSRRVG